MTPAADEVKYYKLCRDIETDERVLAGPDGKDAPGGYYVRSLDHDRIVASLRQQLEQERQLSSTLNAACDSLGSELLAERRKLEQARAALRKYGGHKEECDLLIDNGRVYSDLKCTCGFDAHLSQEGAKEGG